VPELRRDLVVGLLSELVARMVITAGQDGDTGDDDTGGSMEPG
jgi:hypothetical protein